LVDDLAHARLVDQLFRTHPYEIFETDVLPTTADAEVMFSARAGR
jgi:hypothetical protein